MRFDFAVYGPDERLTTVIEAKARGGTTDTWAAQLRKNMVAHANVPRDAMFVLATPGALYLWEPKAQLTELPTYQIDATALFRPYFDRAGVPSGTETVVDPMVFEMIVNSWLQDLATEPVRSDPLLHDSGFVDRVRTGRLVAQLAA